MSTFNKIIRAYGLALLLAAIGSLGSFASITQAGPPPASEICIVNPATCPTPDPNGNNPPTLNVDVQASPGTTGVSPFTVGFQNTVGGTATGTINYTAWWDCPQPGTNIAQLTSLCGNPTDPARGFKVDATNTNPLTRSFVYPVTGTFTYKIVVERSTATPVESQLAITVQSPTLTLSLFADQTTGNTPFIPTVTHDVEGTAIGTINYTVWYNCNQPGNSVAVLITQCGDPLDPAIGFKLNNTNLDPLVRSVTYNAAGTYTYKTVVERGSATPAESRLTLTATLSPPPDLGVQLKINNSSATQTLVGPNSGIAQFILPFTWVRQTDSHDCTLTRDPSDQGLFNPDIPTDPFDDAVASWQSTVTFSAGNLSGDYPVDFTMTCANPVPVNSSVRIIFKRDSSGGGGTPTPSPSPTGNALNFSKSSHQW